MSNYPKIIIDEQKNAPIDVVKEFNTEYYYDFMHHTHKVSDLVNDIDEEEYNDTEIRELLKNKVDVEEGKSLVSDEEIERLANVSNYDDSELKESFNKALDNLYNKIMGITEEDGTTIDEAFDTLKEVAAYIKEDGEAATEMLNKITAIEALLSSKVDVEEGKSLVSNEEIERLSKVDNYDDTEVKESIEAKVSYDKEITKTDLVADHYIDRRNEPYYDEELGYFFANGVPIIIEADPDNTNGVVIKWGYKNSVAITDTSKLKVFGGGDGFITTKSFSHTKITVNSGNVRGIYAGGCMNNIIDNAEVIINGGTVYSVNGGGMSYCDERHVFGTSVVYNSKIIVNNGAFTMIWGGGQGAACINESTIIEFNNGTTTYLGAGGCNGVTENSNVTITGGAIVEYLSCNRGRFGSAELTMSDGSITTFYCGAEVDPDVDATIESFKCNITGGTITNFLVGTDGSTAKATGIEYVEVPMSIDKISGALAEGVATNISDELKAKLQ